MATRTTRATAPTAIPTLVPVEMPEELLVATAVETDVSVDVDADVDVDPGGVLSVLPALLAMSELCQLIWIIGAARWTQDSLETIQYASDLTESRWW